MNVKQRIYVHLVLLLGGTLVGILALALVFCLPTEQMKQHISQSQPMIERDYNDTGVILGNEATLTGNFTDCLMMEHAVYQSEKHNFLEQILIMYRGESAEGDGWAPGYSLADYLDGVEQSREVDYARYWHGYLVVLKPLLFLTTFNSIRIIAGILQFVLAGVVILLCSKRKEELLGVAFLVSVPCLYSFTMYFSLSLSICYYIMIVALIFQLVNHEKWVTVGRYYIFFFVVGMATSYFDLLTYPLITLGFPLCVYLYLDRNCWKEKLKKLVWYSLEWSLGYLGLWTMKWVMADLLVGGNTIGDAMDTLFMRTGSAEEYSRLVGFLAVFRQNIVPYTNWGFYLLALAILIMLIILIAKNKGSITTNTVQQGGILALIVLLPFGWLFLTQNHAEQHWVFTFKILAISVFAGILAIGKALGKGGNGDVHLIQG